MGTEPDTGRARGREIVLFVAGALAYRLLFWLAMPRVVDSADAIRYVALVNQFAAGQFTGFDPGIPILYPLFCALWGFVTPNPELACMLASLCASTLLVIPIYLLAYDLHGRPAARIAALLAAIWPWLADYGCRIAPESLASFLWFLSVWTFARSMRMGGVWLAVAPLSFFALHLARPEGTFLLLAAPLAGLFLYAGKEKRNLVRLIPYVLVCAVLLASYALFMRAATGAATVSYRARGLDATLDFIFVRERYDILRAFIRLFGEVIPIMMGPLLLMFAGVALFERSNRARDLRLELYVLFFACVQWFLAGMSSHAEPRYVMPVLIALSMWSAQGITIVRNQARAATGSRILPALPLAAVLATMIVGLAATVLPEHLGQVPREPREYKIAGLWMKDHLEPGLIVTRKPQVGFYAGMETKGPAYDAAVPDMLAWARAIGARYLVVDERYTAKLIPGLRPLLDPQNAPPGLRVLNADLSPYPEARLVIYEILPDSPTQNRDVIP